MGCLFSKTTDIIIRPTVDYINHFNELRSKFPSISSHQEFEKFILNAIVYPDEYKLIKGYLKSENFIDDNGMLTTSQKPLNVFARIASGAMPTHIAQEPLEHYQETFVICNKPGGSAGHVFMTTKNLHWTYFNVLSIVMNGYVSFLEDMKDAAHMFAASRGWVNIGCYFHCFPHTNVNSLHLHIVNLDDINCKQTYKNLSMQDAIEMAKYVREINTVRCCR